MDLVTGFIKSVISGTYKSSKMRIGLFHKLAVIFTILLSAILEYTAKYVDLPINGKLFVSVCSYIIIMETTSILENINKINPDLLPDKLASIFFKGE